MDFDGTALSYHKLQVTLFKGVTSFERDDRRPTIPRAFAVGRINL